MLVITSISKVVYFAAECLGALIPETSLLQGPLNLSIRTDVFPHPCSPTNITGAPDSWANPTRLLNCWVDTVGTKAWCAIPHWEGAE